MAVDGNILELASRLSVQTPLIGARTRRQACQKLAATRSPQAVPFLVCALSDADEGVREAAGQGLRQMAGPAALDVMALGHAFTHSAALAAILAEKGRTAPEQAELAVEDPPPAEQAWRLRNPKDETELALVPAGEFQAGEAAFSVSLPPFWLALTAVTNAQYARFLSELRPDAARLAAWVRLEPDGPLRRAGEGYEAAPEAEDLPVNTVAWDGADAYAKWAGLRLPTELEWEKGARGVDGRQFPWGDDWSQGRPSLPEGERAREQAVSVRAYPTARSPYGLYQMIGGPYEWCADWFEEGAYERYARGDLRAPARAEHHALRGGPWTFAAPVALRTQFRKSTAWRAGTLKCGFRCARDL